MTGPIGAQTVSRARISRYELGVHEPPLPTARLIADALGAPLTYLYCEDDNIASLLLPSSYILGMSTAVMAAPENQNEHMNDQATFTLFGRQIPINDLWGQKAMVHGIICEKFGNPGLFEGR